MFIWYFLGRKYKIFRVIPVIFIALIILYALFMYYIIKEVEINLLNAVVEPTRKIHIGNTKYDNCIEFNFSFVNNCFFNISFADLDFKFENYQFSNTLKRVGKKSTEKNKKNQHENNQTTTDDVIIEGDGGAKTVNCRTFYKNSGNVKDTNKGKVIIKLKKFFIKFPLPFEYVL